MTAFVAALCLPARTLSMVDGLPLSGRVEAVVAAVVPLLWILHRRFLERRWVRVATALVLALKIAGYGLLTQQGFCARFSTTTPFRGEVLTIPIEEPRGVLRSWDVRADWRADAPACTAIVDRPYENVSAFPAWFLNITDVLNKGRRDLALDLRGFITVTEAGRFALEVDRDMRVTGRIGTNDVASSGDVISATLTPAVHELELHADLVGDRWKLVPSWNGRSAFDAARVTIGPPRAADRWLAPAIGIATLVAVLLLAGGWIGSTAAQYLARPETAAWCAAASAVAIAMGVTGRFERAIGLLLLGAAVVPMRPPLRNWRGALLLLGVPWIAFFVAKTLPQVGHFSPYSNDDWLAYQVAGYRIFMNGFWLEGGSKLFDYQPLYRWLSGAIHLAFGDSSVGETYWDAACLLAGGLAAFALVEPLAGFRRAIAAAAATLAIFTLSPIWYFVGRGLSEIAAAGWAFAATFCLLRARERRIGAAAAGAFAVLMFYTRLNHLLFAGFLVALLLPARAPSQLADAWRAIRSIDWRAAAVYWGTLAVGVALFAARTWWYTGVASVLYGTSLKNNDTGLRLSTLGSLPVWSRIGHSLSALVWVNEPPRVDWRSAIVVAGVLLAALAVLQVPWIKRVPLSLAMVTLGATASSFFAHTHNYPGRMSIHLVPFAVATSFAAASLVTRPSRDAVRHDTGLLTT